MSMSKSPTSSPHAYTRSPDTDIYRTPSPRLRNARRVARGLGWFSIGLGLAEVMLPKTMARITGLHGREALVRLYGLREIATGIGILLSRNPQPFMWGRVAGDALDLVTLTPAALDGPRPVRAAVAMAAVAGVTAADLACVSKIRRAVHASRPPVPDYSHRSGFPLPPAEMIGAARSDFKPPADFQTPAALAPYTTGSGSSTNTVH